MKKIITITTAALFFITAATAQKVTFGFNGGLTMSNYKSQADATSYTSKSKAGLTAGFLTDIPLGKRFSFQPALQFTQKGGVDKESFDGQNYTLTLAMDYIEIPFNFLYRFNSPKTTFYIGGGPTLGYGVSGSAKISIGDEHDKTDIKFGNGDEDDFKPLDRGANILAGVQFKSGVSIALNYNMSLSNLVIDGDKDNEYHNRYFGIRIGYMLKGKKK
jgi:hypothetical protein